jgi:hypothetical protein
MEEILEIQFLMEHDKRINNSRSLNIMNISIQTEVCHILLKRRGVDAQLRFIAGYERGAFELYHFENCELENSIFPLFHNPAQI